MSYLIDTHNHCTWKVDDGIQSKEETIVALQNAKNDGIGEIVATPHFIPGRFDESDYRELSERMDELVSLADTLGVKVHKGSEFFLNDDYLSMLDQKWFHTLANSNYVLMEFDVRKNIGDEAEVEDKFYEFIIRGYQPIIAHVERYFHKGIDLNRIQKWIEMGCYIQVNRTSILGMSGSTSQKNANQLLEAGLVHIVASDMHRNEGRRIGILSDVYSEIVKLYGMKNADLLCKINPKKIILNEKLRAMEKVESKKGLLRFLKRGK